MGFVIRGVRDGKVVRFERPESEGAIRTVERLAACGWRLEVRHGDKVVLDRTEGRR
jgi:hypothetical protein